MAVRARGLGDLLIAQGRISREQLDAALEEQTRTGDRLGEILCRRGWINRDNLLDTLARQFGYGRFDPAKDSIETAALELVPAAFAQRHDVMPVRITGETVVVAMADPTDVEALDHLQRLASGANRRIDVLLASTDVLEKARDANYRRIEGSRNVNRLIDEVMVEVSEATATEEDTEEGEAQRKAQDAGIINLVDQIVAQAVQERATDIHVEPQERALVIRYRVDGLLYIAHTPPRAVYTGVISRIKILANMDIAERRAAQDGRFSHRMGGRDVDIRVSGIPTIHGEKLVLRLLDKGNFNFSLQDLGYSEADYRILQHGIRQPYGMVLLSGPTGSGKSTTLYASLLELRDDTLNVTTVEDPVEYQIPGINQVAVNSRKQVTFATALRYFLRQDPDVIMVGEIRDGETAAIAVRAALTGHMVFSTIHANDAPTTATRLISMGGSAGDGAGVESFMAASALTLVAAQRLVRRNCTHCLEEYQPSEETLLAMRLDRASLQGKRFVRGTGAGCAACKGRGFQGRTAIVEMMPITQGIRELVAARRPASEIRQKAREDGMRTLRESGVEKAIAGQTTLEEVLRVCLSDE